MKRKLLCLFTILIGMAVLLPAQEVEDSVDGTIAEQFYSDIRDDGGILSDDDVESLNFYADSIAEKYEFGIYIVTVKDMTEYGYYDIEDFGEYFYKKAGYGVGSEKNGLMLILSMAERDYDICAYGSNGHYSFTDYGKDKLADSFIPDFKLNDWNSGFESYLEEVDYYLKRAGEGNPVDVKRSSSSDDEFTIGYALLAGFVVAFIIALIFCLAKKKQLKNVAIGKNAAAYVDNSTVKITSKADTFSHRTTSRIKIETPKSSGGGTTISSGGFSHSSGKF